MENNKQLYIIDFDYKGGTASTLDVLYLGDNESGWTINGEIIEDYYKWVNYFEATHEKFGMVYGDFEKTVYADTKEAYDHFINNHPPIEWDYREI